MLSNPLILDINVIKPLPVRRVQSEIGTGPWSPNPEMLKKKLNYIWYLIFLQICCKKNKDCQNETGSTAKATW